MKYVSYVIAFSFSTSLLGQVELPKDVLKAAEMLSVSQEDIPGVMNIKYSIDPKDCPPEIKKEIEKKNSPIIILDNHAKDGWRFSMRTMLTGPKDKLEKSFVAKSPNKDLKSKLDKIIQTDYKSYDDRLKDVGRACQGMSDMDKIQMGSQLATRLSAIYDYSRSDDNGANANDVVKPETLWSSLKAGEPAGVCRDASITVSQFLMACGFKKDQLAIKSYRTQGGGHQVTSIVTKDGEYTINWSELYEYTDANGKILAPDPNLPNTGLFYTLYDPETGKLLEQRRTDYANALKVVAGGKPIDPTYTPNMMLAEASFGGLAAKIFELETDRGDQAKGLGLSYSEYKGDDRSFVDLSMGGAYSFSKRDVPVSATTDQKLHQEVLFVQTDMKVQKAIPIFSTEDGKVSLAPSLRTSIDLSMAANEYKDQESKSMEFYSEVAGGATVYYDGDPIKAHMGGEISNVVTPRLYNSENGKSQYGIEPTRYTLEAGASWEGERITTSANADLIITDRKSVV